MKQFLTLAALISLGAPSWAQIIDPYECHCGVEISAQTGLLVIYQMMPFQMDSCDIENQQTCTDLCAQEWSDLCPGGELLTELDNGYNCGQEICTGAINVFHPVVDNKKGFIVSQLCEGTWEDTGLTTKQNIC